MQFSKKIQRSNTNPLAFTELSSLRVVQKNLVYISSIPDSLATPDLLTSHEYFGQYGTIVKCVVSKNKSVRRPCSAAYITFSSAEEAAVCIKATNFFKLGQEVLEVALGTTRYCTHFLNNQRCPRTDCLFLHERQIDCEIFLKDAYSGNKRSLVCVNSAELERFVVETPKATVLPPVRRLSEDELAERRLECEPESPSYRRTQSRFTFARGPAAEPMDNGPVIDLVKVNSPSKTHAHISSDQFEDIMSSKGSVAWAGDLFHAIPVRKSFNVTRFGELDDVYLISSKHREFCV